VAEPSTLSIKLNKSVDGLKWAAEYELMRICALCKFEFSIPSQETSYDLLVDFGNGFKKIQVKSSYCKSGKANYVFSLDRTRFNTNSSRKVKYSSNECNYFFLYDWNYNKWLIPFELLKNKGSVTPMLRYPGYKVEL
jgi:hypothetical protein